MATVAQCEHAMHELAARLAGADPEHRRKANLDRTLSCTVTDLDVVFAARLNDGTLSDIRQVDSPEAKIRMRLSSDDLLSLVDGELNVARAWSQGRLRIEGSVMDLLKLRTIF